MTAAPPARPTRRHSPRRRLVVRVAVAVVALLVLLWLGGAWYFSDVLYADGLRIDPPPAGPVTDVEVVAVDEGTVTLRAGENQPEEVTAPGVWGLAWDGGYARLTDVVERDGDDVTRAFTLVQGTAPEPGTLADVDKYLFADDPDDVLGLAWEQVELRSPLGTLDAWFVPGSQPTSDTWAILVHGKGSDRDEMLRMLGPLHRAGLPALVITYRGDRDQPVDPAGVYRYGATEWQDLDAAVAHALDRGASALVLGGASTGAAVIGSWLENGSRTDAAVALVLDAANTDVERTFGYGASQREIPVTGWPVPGALAWTAFRLAELRFPIDFSEVDVSDTLAATDVPVLVIHGTGDRTVPVAAARDLVAERRADGLPVTYLETEAGEHVGSYNHDPTTYEDTLEQFIADVIG